jgi:hypothetical protein
MSRTANPEPRLERRSIMAKEKKDDHDKDHDKDHDRHHKCKHRDHDHDHDHDHKRKHKDCHEEEHVRELGKRIKKVGEMMEKMGRGEHMHELHHIVCEPGWTKKAELGFVCAILEHMHADLCSVERLQCELVEACWKVGHKCK